MKKHILILCILLSANLHAQHYNFNLLTNYNIQVETTSNDRLVYSHTGDPNIFLTVKGNNESKEAQLLDIGRLMVHRFKIDQIVEKGDVFFKFAYIKSEIIKPEKGFMQHDFTIKVIAQDSLTKTVEVSIFKNAKKKKPVMTQTLTMKKYHVNLFPLYRVSGLHPFEMLSKIDISGNYIVTGGKGKAFLGHTLMTKLVYTKEIALELVVPENH